MSDAVRVTGKVKMTKDRWEFGDGLDGIERAIRKVIASNMEAMFDHTINTEFWPGIEARKGRGLKVKIYFGNRSGDLAVEIDIGALIEDEAHALRGLNGRIVDDDGDSLRAIKAAMLRLADRIDKLLR